MSGIADILGDMGSGAATGSIGGPPGAIIGAGVGLATGLIQNIGAASAKKKADAAMPGLIDPRQASFLAELEQKRKAIDTGADFGAGMNAVNNINAGTNNAIVKSSGGDVGGTVQGLLQSEQIANNGANSVLAQGQGQQLAYNSMFNDLNNKIAARQLQLEMAHSQQARAEWAQKKQMANQNTMAGTAGLLSSFLPQGNSTSSITPPGADTGANPDILNFLNKGGTL